MSKLSTLALNDEGFAFDPSTGESYVLNDAALFIVNALRAGKAAPEIVTLLVGEYDVDEHEAEQDVADLAERLASFGLK